ncbi:MAG TPA: carbamoyltransferase C-terminal domain-containing protein [Vicinamibacterales bacterium]|nr:carbamoyltransferase C-terminal domain-containing protein [Vicinamibacterales bacterium]
MKVLGLSPLDKDSTVTIVEDGVITYAAAEERFTRVKLQNGFPWQALEDALDRTGTKAEEIDRVVYPFLPYDEETRLFERNLEKEREFLEETEAAATSEEIQKAKARIPARREPVPGLADPNERQEKGLLKNLAYRVLASEGVVSRNVAKRGSEQWGREASKYHFQWHQQLESGLAEVGFSGKLKRVEHHLSHAANAYYTSGYDEALIVTLDGYGSGLAGSISVGRDGKIERVHGLEYPHSLGTFYESVTSALGFTPSRHEGKIVGLAAYGDPEVLGDVLRRRFVHANGGFRIVETNNVYFARLLAAQFPKIDVAAAYQRVLEEVAVAYVSQHLKKTGLRHLVLSGGVVANVKLNQRLREIEGVDGIFIHPNMGDGGCGTGAALAEFAGSEPTRKRINDVYLGPSYTGDEIAEALKRAGLPFTRYTPIEPKIAMLLAAGKVVARFDGRMEYGPRALGHRSILYHAKEPSVNQWLNQRLGRTEFMPFAPATLHEHRHANYKLVDGADYAAEFMTITFDCTPSMIRDCPAAVHVDGTARPQLVTATGSPGFHRLLTEYHKLTGIPTLINTSFNMHEEPIVCSPDDAIRAFLQGNLDVLAIGEFLVEHPKRA